MSHPLDSVIMPINTTLQPAIRTRKDLEVRIVTYVDERATWHGSGVSLRSLGALFGVYAHRFDALISEIVVELHNEKRLVLWTPPKGGRVAFSRSMVAGMLEDATSLVAERNLADELTRESSVKSAFDDMMNEKAREAVRTARPSQTAFAGV